MTAGTARRGAREIVEEMLRMVNHAAGPQGRSGLASILRTIDRDLGPVTLEQHHLIGDGDLVAQHLTLHGTHRGSTMPLLAGLPPSGRPTTWTFIHIWRVADGMIVEHWACRDDMGLLEQVGAGSRRQDQSAAVRPSA
jgi:predicted ester cyclase